MQIAPSSHPARPLDLPDEGPMLRWWRYRLVDGTWRDFGYPSLSWRSASLPPMAIWVALRMIHGPLSVSLAYAYLSTIVAFLEGHIRLPFRLTEVGAMVSHKAQEHSGDS